jgi:hypothetical protein
MSLKNKSIGVGFSDPDWSNQDDIDQFIALASKKMKVLAVMAGNQNYLQTLDAMREHFTYVREIAYLVPGAGNRLDPDTMNISTGFKPVLVGSFNLKRGFYNVVRSEKAEHDLHPWGLNLSAVQRIIEYLSDPGDLVADCYCGGGSTALSCVKSGRRFIGCDNGLVSKLVKGAPPEQTWADVAIARVNEELEMQLKKVA